MTPARGRLPASSCRATLKPWSTDVETARVDDGSAGEQRPEHVVDVPFELGDLGAHEPAEPVDIAGPVEESEELTQPRRSSMTVPGEAPTCK